MQNQPQGSNWQVLVIEDEVDNRDVIVAALRFYKMAVKSAANGLEAIEMLQEVVPDFILCDLAMPKMDGWATLLEIRANPKTMHVPVIALTAYAMIGDREKALAKGFDGYITKPIEVLTIYSTLKTIMAAIAEKTANQKAAGQVAVPPKTVQPVTLSLPPAEHDDNPNGVPHHN